QGPRWKVTLDVISRPLITDEAAAPLGAAVEVLVRTGQVAGGANFGTEYIVMRGIEGEDRAREIASAFHAAMHGLQQLHIAVPTGRRAPDSGPSVGRQGAADNDHQ
ncbi:MAG TPA: hypothetical protein VFH94_23360, partial [Streptomyces sp.]|nr:hypothetical protein [Streptomyces sp.]